MMVQPLLCAVNWGVVGWVLVGTVVLIFVVAAIGRAIAAAFPPSAEHVSNFRKPASAPAPAAVPAASASAAPAAAASRAVPASAAAGSISPEIMAVIAASVAVALRGQRFSITGVAPAPQKAPDIEQLMSLWSLEGRRQVYSSHTLPR